VKLPLVVLVLTNFVIFSPTYADGTGLSSAAKCQNLLLSKSTGEDWEFAVDPSKVLRQEENTVVCGPLSLFNSFAISESKFQETEAKLSGATLKQKFERYFELFANQPSPFGGKRFTPETGGMSLANLYFVAKDFLKFGSGTASTKLRAEPLFRAEQESNGQLLQRFEKMVRESLENGMAPILGHSTRQASTSWDYKDGVDKSYPKPELINILGFSYMRGSPHFVTITGIKRVSSSAIKLRIYDQVYGRTFDLNVSEGQFDMGDEARDTYQRINPGDDTVTVIHDLRVEGKMVNSKGQVVKSPILMGTSDEYLQARGCSPNNIHSTTLDFNFQLPEGTPPAFIAIEEFLGATHGTP
jgi:hypothetical protein